MQINEGFVCGHGTQSARELGVYKLPDGLLAHGLGAKAAGRGLDRFHIRLHADVKIRNHVCFDKILCYQCILAEALHVQSDRAQARNCQLVQHRKYDNAAGQADLEPALARAHQRFIRRRFFVKLYTYKTDDEDEQNTDGDKKQCKLAYHISRHVLVLLDLCLFIVFKRPNQKIILVVACINNDDAVALFELLPARGMPFAENIK